MGSVPVGCLRDPDHISASARVPRGRLDFDAEFAHALGSALQDGPRTFADLERLLCKGHEGAHATAVRRNLGYAVAAGVVGPFARLSRGGRSGTPRPVNAAVERRLAALALGDRADRVASPLLGAAVTVQPGEAAAAVAARPRLNNLTRLVRLGVVA